MASQDPVSLRNRRPFSGLDRGLIGRQQGSNRDRCSISNIACTALQFWSIESGALHLRTPILSLLALPILNPDFCYY